MPALADQLMLIVGTIAFHDWSESWPEFLPRMMVVFDSARRPAQAKTCRILAKFIHQVNSSLHITFSRRSETITAFLESVPKRFLFFVPETDDLSSAYLEFATNLTVLIASEGDFAERGGFLVQCVCCARSVYRPSNCGTAKPAVARAVPDEFGPTVAVVLRGWADAFVGVARIRL